MRKRATVFLPALIILSVGTWIVHAQQPAAPSKLEKVKDDLYVISGDGGNTTVYLTSEGVILVDDKYDQDHEGILAAVKQVTPLPVKYVISTHHHADHSGGNTKMFSSGADIISTAMARKNIVEKKQSNAPPGMTPGSSAYLALRGTCGPSPVHA